MGNIRDELRKNAHRSNLSIRISGTKGNEIFLVGSRACKWSELSPEQKRVAKILLDERDKKTVKHETPSKDMER